MRQFQVTSYSCNPHGWGHGKSLSWRPVGSPSEGHRKKRGWQMVNWWKTMENWRLKLKLMENLGIEWNFEDHHDFSKKAQSFPQEIWRNKEWKWVIHRRNLSNNLDSPGFSCLLSGMETRRNGNDSITTMLVEPYCGACFGTGPWESCMVGFCQRVMVERTLQVGKAISAPLYIYHIYISK